MAARQWPQLRAIVTGRVAGARGRFGGLGTRLTNIAGGLEVAVETNQETVTKLAQEQNREWRQPAVGRRGVKQKESQLNHSLPE